MTMIVLLSLLVTRAGPEGSTNVADVVDRWEAGVRLIESYDLSVHLSTTSYVFREANRLETRRLLKPSETFPPLRFYSRIYRSGEKRRGDFGGDGKGRFQSSLIFDGQTHYAVQGLASSSLQYDVRPMFSVFGSYEYEDYEALYRTIKGTVDRIRLTRERGGRLLPREGNLFVVEVPESDRGDWARARWKLWLDPAKNFLPARWSQWFVRPNGLVMRDLDCEVTLKEVAAGVWAPVRGVIQTYGKDVSDPVFFDKCIGVSTLEVVPESARFNVPIPDEVFAVKIPRGTTVIDRIRNVVYREGDSDPDAYLAGLAANAKAGLEKTSKGPTPKGRRGPADLILVPEIDRPWRRSVPWILAATLPALAVLVFARWRKARAR